VLVDLARHFGRERKLIGYDEMAAVMAQDGVSVERGDFLVLRTGFAELVMEMGGNPDPQVLHHTCPVLNGRDQRLLQWITDSGIAAICADNYAVEAYPAPDVAGRKSILPLHHHCLFKLGIPLGELWYLRDLAAWLQQNGRSRFMLTAPPLRLPGAVGSPVTPVATV
jgi:kynurenine formamidase